MKEKPLTEFMGSKKGAKEHKEKPAKPKVAGLKGPWELPEGWRWVRLGEILVFQYGISKKLSEGNQGYPILRMNNITYDGKLDLSDLKFVKLSEEEFKKYRLEKGDILINRTNSKELVGKTTVFNVEGDYVFASYIIRGKLTKPDIVPEFIAMFLNSPYMKMQFLEMARQAVQMANINARELSRILIPLPPLSEQKHIVAKLNEVSKRLEEAKRLAREAREEAERLMASALHEVFSKAEEKRWEWVRLGEVADYINGYHFGPKDWKEKGIPIVRIQNLTNPNAPFNYFDGNLDKKYLINSGDILIAWSASLGVFKWTGGKAWLNQHIFKVVFKREDILREYYYYATKSVINDMLAETHGSVMKHITKPKFLRIKIPLPPLEEQKRIVAYLDSIHERAQKLVKLYEEREREFERLFPAILDRAFRGELV